MGQPHAKGDGAEADNGTPAMAPHAAPRDLQHHVQSPHALYLVHRRDWVEPGRLHARVERRQNTDHTHRDNCADNARRVDLKNDTLDRKRPPIRSSRRPANGSNLNHELQNGDPPVHRQQLQQVPRLRPKPWTRPKHP